MKTILHLCADIGSDTAPYSQLGYNVIKIGKDIGVENYSPPADVHGIIANPPCLEFSSARAGGKAREPEIGMILVRECLRIIEEAGPKWWVIENPATGALKQFMGKPAFVYQPWWYGLPWTKKTAPWGEFNPPPRVFYQWEDVPKNPALYTRPGRSKPAMVSMHKSHKRFIPEFEDFEVEDELSFRSLCSQNFAYAFLRANP